MRLAGCGRPLRRRLARYRKYPLDVIMPEPHALPASPADAADAVIAIAAAVSAASVSAEIANHSVVERKFAMAMAQPLCFRPRLLLSSRWCAARHAFDEHPHATEQDIGPDKTNQSASNHSGCH
jgi:hypothetical protein